MQTVEFRFRALAETEPGAVWRRYFEESWPWYRSWYLSEGEEARPSYAVCARMVREHLPELIPTYERLVELAGGGDLEARALSFWHPPPYLAACSQGVSVTGAAPVLVRNYDYAPSRLEGAVWSTAWGGRRVIGMSDGLWGLLDGMNDAGLAVSLTFGGSRATGLGFGIPVVLRYLLQTCTTVAESRAALSRVPLNLAHNVTVVDARGEVMTAYLGPGREPTFLDVAVATNHQVTVEWQEHAAATRTVERETLMQSLLAAECAAGGVRGCVSRAAPLLERVLTRLRHALHRCVPSTRRACRLPLARWSPLDEDLRGVPAGCPHGASDRGDSSVEGHGAASRTASGRFASPTGRTGDWQTGSRTR